MTQLAELSDQQIEKMSRSALQQAAAVEIAVRECRPVVGEIFPDDGDTAETIYEAALGLAGVSLEGIAPSEYRAMVRLLAETGGKGVEHMAGDAAPRHQPNPAMSAIDRIGRR